MKDMKHNKYMGRLQCILYINYMYNSSPHYICVNVLSLTSDIRLHPTNSLLRHFTCADLLVAHNPRTPSCSSRL